MNAKATQMFGMVGCALAVIFTGCAGEEEEPELCEQLTIDVSVIRTADQDGDGLGDPVATADVEFNNAPCVNNGDATYTCITPEADGYQLVVLEPNSTAWSQFLQVPAIEEWCDKPNFAVDVVLQPPMGM